MERINLYKIPMVYAIGHVAIDKNEMIIAASEKQGGPAFIIDPEDGYAEKIWDGPGGVMAMIGVEDRAFISIDEFYPVFKSEAAAVYLTRIIGDRGSFSFEKNKLFDLPWCHRVVCVREKHGRYLVAGSLCKKKEFVEDWSTKGSVYVTPFDGSNVGELINILPEAITKHHAMWVHDNGDGTDDVYVGGSEGIYRCYMEEDIWKTEKILEAEVSDIAIADLDGDGLEELAIIEGFHGNKLKILHMNGDSYECVYETDFEFGHVLWSGNISGQNSLLLGSRAGDKFLKLIKYKDSKYVESLVDTDVGPAQVTVFNSGAKTVIVAAEHGANKVAEYCL